MENETKPSHVVIGDIHTFHKDPQERFTVLGRFLAHHQPTSVIFIGDLFDFLSFSTYDKPGSKEREGVRLVQEILAAQQALAAVIKEFPEDYKPDIYFCEGNHEYRLHRWVEQNPYADGLFDLPNLVANALAPHKVGYVPYGSYVRIDGILYTHIPIKNGQPLASTVNITGAALAIVDESVVFGHTHRLESKQILRAGSFRQITALNVGCYFTHIPKYVAKSVPNWWRGVVQVFPKPGSQLDYRTWAMFDMFEEFGDKEEEEKAPKKSVVKKKEKK